MSLIRKITICLLGAGTLLSPAPSVSAEDPKAAGHYVDVGIPQVPLRLWTEESGSGEPVLLIHGLGESIYTWRSFLPNLARSYRTIAVDLKGAGKSDKPNDEAYSILDQAALLKTFVDREARAITMSARTSRRCCNTLRASTHSRYSILAAGRGATLRRLPGSVTSP